MNLLFSHFFSLCIGWSRPEKKARVGARWPEQQSVEVLTKSHSPVCHLAVPIFGPIGALVEPTSFTLFQSMYGPIEI